MSNTDAAVEETKLQDRPVRVVRNQEEQYSIWPVNRELPDGWLDCGVSGTRDECLRFISETWVDMRPLSVRRLMEATGGGV